MAKESCVLTTFKMFNTKTFRDNLHIPDAIWKEMEPPLRETIQKLKEKIWAKRAAEKVQETKSVLPDQYPTMKSKETALHLCS